MRLPHQLPKLRQVLVGHDEPALAAWCRFLSAETDSEREALAMQYPILKDARDALDRLSADPAAIEAAERREIELKLHEYGVNLERERGRTEGRAHGKQQALERQLVLKFGELPAEHQARIATSTEADLDRWIERVVTASTLGSVFSS
jgi:hypothetical protein